MSTAERSSTTPLDPSSVDALQSRLRGQLIGPDQPAYTQARQVWNGMIDPDPVK